MPNSLKASGRRVFHRKYFSPIELSGVEAWYDASDTGTITETAGQVDQWDDKSGNGYHLTPGFSLTGPVTNSSTQNSLNVLEFNGDSLVNDLFSHDVSSPIYIAFLVEMNNQVAEPEAQYFLWTGTDNSTNRCAIRKRVNTSQLTEIFGKDINTNNVFVSFGNADGTDISKGVFNILIAKIQNSNAATYVNGTLKNTGDSGIHNLNRFYLGHQETGGANFYGRYAEVIAFKDGNDREKVEGYLAHKWGQTGSLPSDHPYKNNKP